MLSILDIVLSARALSARSVHVPYSISPERGFGFLSPAYLVFHCLGSTLAESGISLLKVEKPRTQPQPTKRAGAASGAGACGARFVGRSEGRRPRDGN